MITSYEKDSEFTFSYTNLKNHPELKPFNHSHLGYEFLLILSGEATHTVNGEKHIIKKGDLIVNIPNSEHEICITKDTHYERYDFLISEKYIPLENISSLINDNFIINCLHNEVILNLFKRLNLYSQILDKKEFISVAGALAVELICNLNLLKNNKITSYAQSPILKTALEFIDDNAFTIKSVKEISNAIFVSETYLYKIFNEELKTTPNDYILDIKLKSAKQMLMLGQKPTVVYKTCGFKDYSSFYRNYCKKFGVSPSNEKTATYKY